jgi:hypothetical protein
MKRAWTAPVGVLGVLEEELHGAVQRPVHKSPDIYSAKHNAKSFAKFRVLSSNWHIKPPKIVGPLREISLILKKLLH